MILFDIISLKFGKLVYTRSLEKKKTEPFNIYDDADRDQSDMNATFPVNLREVETR